jgi:transposase
MDRDKVAAVNLARRGRARFARSQPLLTEAQGGAVEAVSGEHDAYGNTWSRML